MKVGKSLFLKLFLSLLLLLPFLFPVSASAATFRSGDSITIDQSLTDLYAAGSTVTISAPVRNDLAIAGGTLTIEQRVTNSLFAAGGTINITGPVGNTLRAAGGTIRLAAPVRRDAVIFGGNITLDSSASISGDLVVNGGQVNVQGPVRGNIIINGGAVTLNAPVGKNVQANVDTLIIGRDAVINGNLNYSSPNRVTVRDGATIKGQQNYKHIEPRNKNHGAGAAVLGAITGWSLYKLIADILGCLALVYLLYAFTNNTVLGARAEPLRNGLLGLAVFILGPIVALFLLILIFPGLLAFLFYGLLLLLAAFISKLFIGWLVLRWWYGRNNTEYQLDWKAAVLGPILMLILAFIPILGWLVRFILFLIALGSIAAEFYSYISSPRDIIPAEAPAPVHHRTSRPAAKRISTRKKK